ncbi:hypothetical protein DLM78_14365 [Leptospira stimsonii]|uniref:Uncharacterized protein n=1 Tax=Leptospira stimsonii TaxID=2202203 RepID=A0A8B3CQI3_9LEPT|nr:hypothetical protein DLM78_14365 [Leptospira stimsonii]
MFFKEYQLNFNQSMWELLKKRILALRLNSGRNSGFFYRDSTEKSNSEGKRTFIRIIRTSRSEIQIDP